LVRHRLWLRHFYVSGGNGAGAHEWFSAEISEAMMRP
jgi:hypothetical protein